MNQNTNKQIVCISQIITYSDGSKVEVPVYHATAANPPTYYAAPTENNGMTGLKRDFGMTEDKDHQAYKQLAVPVQEYPQTCSVQCACGAPMTLKCCQSGPNTGRKYYNAYCQCQKPQKVFKWADELYIVPSVNKNLNTNF